MVQHNSGVSFSVWDHSTQSWQSIEEGFLEEARSYRWRCMSNEPIQITMQSVPLLMTKMIEGWEGVFETPFQSGFIQFEIRTGEQLNRIESYVYPDGRKLTLQQYETLLQEVIEEAVICFEKGGLEADVNAAGFSRKCSMLQWNYIESQIIQLRTIFRKMESHPLRVLRRKEEIVKREKIKQITPSTLSWMERYGQTYGGSPSRLPSHLKSTIVKETFNVYENQVVLAQLNELRKLLQDYSKMNHAVIRKKALQYIDWISRWKKTNFLNKVKPHIGTIKITQVFRKHPMYRLWFQWFQNLYNYKNITFDIKDRLPLKDTYELYEMWCYMQIVKSLRELDLLESPSDMFTYQDNYYFLNLSENKQSVVHLVNGAKLTYQKIIQNNTKPYYSYTQRMIPDIVIENRGSLYVLDPKYRVSSNLSMALGEMHKYRDGILNSETDQKVVEEVYILTPKRAVMPEEKDFYDQDFHQKYKMGAFCFKPGVEIKGFKDWVKGLFF
ncbi:DUF2357 domain-containing protein [Virgibacillus sp. C22-A2]|uniref:DUF2357 domain-containing protein n=1 Tax=Virgibacillus tibetensis TaxID=3042313 RepID=A0ABU6KLK3_9BACI|nr:DUF2357 domain-containing protein [Virgibacillus sp. C22-A2]